MSRKVGNSIFTVFFEEKKKELKPAGLIVVNLDNKGQEKSLDKIPISECKLLVDILFFMGL